MKSPYDLATTPDADEGQSEAALQLHKNLIAMRQQIVSEVAQTLLLWGPAIVRPDFQSSAANLAAYLAFRKLDLRPIQDELAAFGLSSLGRCESHVMPSIDA